MSFDIDQTLNGMVTAVAGVLAGEWPNIQDYIKKAIIDEKENLREIAQARLLGEINDEDMASQMDDEKEVLRATFLVCKVKEKAALQKAANAAADAFTKAIATALKI